MRGRPVNTQFVHPGFCPTQEMASQSAPRRFFRPGHRGTPRPMGPMSPRGPARFPPPRFNRPGLHRYETLTIKHFRNLLLVCLIYLYNHY